ncbi:MAG: hypothetical protein Ct9H300mP1_15780 [Planctomycetaceae bacterium]|nr:MAG: hypothetical protein Ct9H300mP1_15780 [Planctomycetaceae bacterium]
MTRIELASRIPPWFPRRIWSAKSIVTDIGVCGNVSFEVTLSRWSIRRRIPHRTEPENQGDTGPGAGRSAKQGGNIFIESPFLVLTTQP